MKKGTALKDTKEAFGDWKISGSSHYIPEQAIKNVLDPGEGYDKRFEPMEKLKMNELLRKDSGDISKAT